MPWHHRRVSESPRSPEGLRTQPATSLRGTAFACAARTCTGRRLPRPRGGGACPGSGNVACGEVTSGCHPFPPPFPFLCASLPGSHPRERFLSHALPPPSAAGYAEAGARNKTTEPVVIRTCRGSPPPGGCRPGLPLAAAAANHRQSLTVPDSSFLSAARERPGARCWILKAPALVAMRILCGESRIRVASESGQSRIRVASESGQSRIRVASESGQSRIRVASESCGSREPGRCAAACHAPLNAT